MLAAAKVKLHGMCDKRWKFQDKITQYRGIIKLFERDRKILQTDLHAQQRRLKRCIVETRKEIKLQRAVLDNASSGDRQAVKNMLSDHDDVKYALGGIPITAIEEQLSQINFLQRKKLDLLKHKTKITGEKMVKLKLDHAALEDMENAYVTKSRSEAAAEIVCGKLQDMILKKDAAIAVGDTYKKILKIMKNDHYYMDGVIGALTSDSKNQGHCINMTIQVGQLAVEYLDDRKVEFRILELCIKLDMESRLRSIEEVHNTVGGLKTQLKSCIRKESDICIGISTQKNQDTDLLTSIDGVEQLLKSVKDTVRVSVFEQIYPCLIAQRNNFVRLQTMTEKITEDRNKLLNKKVHASFEHERQTTTMVESTLEYTERRNALTASIKEKEEQLRRTQFRIKKRGELTLVIRKDLHVLQQMCLPIMQPIGKPSKQKVKIKEKSEATLQPDTFSTEGEDVIDQLKRKLAILMTMSVEVFSVINMDAYNFYAHLMNSYHYTDNFQTRFAEESLVEGVRIVDVSIPTRESVKEESARLFLELSKDPDLVPAVEPRRKPRKF